MKLSTRTLLAVLIFSSYSFAQTPRTNSRAPARPAAAAKEEEEDEPDDEKGEGDPFQRYERSTSKNQICDPTILAEFYKKRAYLACLVTPSGVCLNPGKDEFTYAVYGAFTGVAGGVLKGLAARHAARLEVLKGLDTAARTAAASTMEALAGRSAAQVLTAAKPLLLTETERAAARSIGGIVLRNGGRGALLGFLSGGAIGVAVLAIDISLTHGISSTGCGEVMENDPNFRKYVPLEKGTCHTPIFNAGAPQVLEFMKLPLKEKMKILDGNRRICGFYHSMNEEMDVRIAQLEGGRAIGSVTCDAATGDINFKVSNNSSRTMIIKRKPRTKELTSFQFRDYAAPDVVLAGANFELVKTENGTDLSRIQILNQGFTHQTRNIPYEEFPAYWRQHPDKAQTLLHAFRTSRFHAQTLMSCCDKTPAEMQERATKEECPPDWFPAKTPLPAPRPKTTR